MSNSSDSSSPVVSSRVSLSGEGECYGGGEEEEDEWMMDGGSGRNAAVGLFDQLKVLESSDRVRELQTIIRDR